MHIFFPRFWITASDHNWAAYVISGEPIDGVCDTSGRCESEDQCAVVLHMVWTWCKKSQLADVAWIKRCCRAARMMQTWSLSSGQSLHFLRVIWWLAHTVVLMFVSFHQFLFSSPLISPVCYEPSSHCSSIASCLLHTIWWVTVDFDIREPTRQHISLFSQTTSALFIKQDAEKPQITDGVASRMTFQNSKCESSRQ